MLKKLIVSAVIISLPLALAARGGRGMRPAPQRGFSGGAVKPSVNIKPPTVPVTSPRPPAVQQRPDNKVPVIHTPGRPPQSKPPKPPHDPHGPHRPGHKPPPPPQPAWRPGHHDSRYVPVVPVVYYGDVPTDYTYAWYNDKYVIYWRGWFWYKAAWVWGGQGAAPAPPTWRPL